MLCKIHNILVMLLIVSDWLLQFMISLMVKWTNISGTFMRVEPDLKM